MSERRCPKCGSVYTDTARFCPKDGTMLVEIQAKPASSGSGTAVRQPPVSGKGQGLDRASTLSNQILDARYQVLKKLGEGGMSYVYLAKEISSEATVAIKVLSPRLASDKSSVERLRREAGLAMRLEHPNVCRILRLGESEDGLIYLVMPFLKGELLSDREVRGGPMDLAVGITLLQEMCAGLHHAHELQIIHRDLKPENILVDRVHQPRITDFGLAKMVGSSVQKAATATGTSLGTPAYMSPEQVRGDRTVDGRTDVYALGVMLYELLAGRRPFEGESAYEIMMKAVNSPVTAPSKIATLQINPVLYRSLENICLTALAKDPAQRYHDADALARDLSAWLKGGDVRAVAPRGGSRRLILIGAAAAAVLLAAAGIAGMILRDRDDKAGVKTAAMVKAETLQPGLIAEYYAGVNFNALGIRKIDTRSAFDDVSQPLWRDGQSGWTSRRWFGYLRVPSTGNWSFEIKAEEAARLVIDGIELYKGNAAMTRSAQLGEGPHKFLLEHMHGGPNDTVSIAMRRADARPETAEKLGPGSLFHSIKEFKPVLPQSPFRNWMQPVPGAEEGESIAVLEHSGHAPQRKGYAYYASFWKGSWSASEHLWWGPGVQVGDRLRVRFTAQRAGTDDVALGLTHAADHGIFKVSVNGTVAIDRLDLYSADLLTEETLLKDVALKTGANELEFEVVGTNPAAREWGPGAGIHKLGLDHVLVR